MAHYYIGMLSDKYKGSPEYWYINFQNGNTVMEVFGSYDKQEVIEELDKLWQTTM